MSQRPESFLPTPEILAGVRRQLLDAGIPSETIPDAWMPYIIGGMRKWIGTTRDGAADAAELIGLRVTPGESDKNYMLVDSEEVVELRAGGDDVWFVQGVMLSGTMIDPAKLRVSEKTREPCDGCGIIGFCLKTVRDPGTDSLKSLCNYCCTSDESPHIRDLGDVNQCMGCSVVACSHNPNRNRGFNSLR